MGGWVPGRERENPCFEHRRLQTTDRPKLKLQGKNQILRFEKRTSRLLPRVFNITIPILILKKEKKEKKNNGHPALRLSSPHQPTTTTTTTTAPLPIPTIIHHINPRPNRQSPNLPPAHLPKAWPPTHILQHVPARPHIRARAHGPAASRPLGAEGGDPAHDGEPGGD